MRQARPTAADWLLECFDPADWADLLDMEPPPPPAPPLPQPVRPTTNEVQTDETVVVLQADAARSLTTAEDLLNRVTDVDRLTILVGLLHGPARAALFQATAAYEQQLAQTAAVGRCESRGRGCHRQPSDAPGRGPCVAVRRGEGAGRAVRLHRPGRLPRLREDPPDRLQRPGLRHAA